MAQVIARPRDDVERRKKRPTAEQLFGLCKVVSPLLFFQQFNGDRTAAVCFRMVLRRFHRGVQLSLRAEADLNPLFVVLDGALMQGDWILKPGDTFGYRPSGQPQPLHTISACRLTVSATSDVLIGQLDVEMASEIFASLTDAEHVCWTPELSRTLLKTKPRDERSADDVAVIVNLLDCADYARRQPSDLRFAIARLATLRTLIADERVEAYGGDTLYIVLSGSIAAVDRTCRIDLRAGDSFPPHVLEHAFAARALRRHGKKKKAKKQIEPQRFAGSYSFMAETQRAEILELGVTHFVSRAFPSAEVPYSLEYCKRVLLKHPTTRLPNELRRLTQDVLLHLPFFAQLPAATCRCLARLAQLDTLRNDRWRQASSGWRAAGSLNVILSGVVEIEFADGTSATLKPCDSFGRRTLLEQTTDEMPVRVRALQYPADIATLSSKDYRSVHPRRPMISVDNFSDAPALAAAPRCLRRKLAKLSQVREFGPHQVIGSVHQSHGLILSGSVSIFYAVDDDDDDDEAALEDRLAQRREREAEMCILGARRLDDCASRRCWAKIGAGMCAYVLDAGQSLGAALSKLPDRFSSGLKRRRRGVIVSREPTRVVQVDPEALAQFFECEVEAASTRASQVAHKLAQHKKFNVHDDKKTPDFGLRPVSEDILELLSNDPDLDRLPQPIKLRLAHAARLETVGRGDALSDGTARKFILSGAFEVVVAREPPDLHDDDDFETLERRELWSRNFQVGHLLAGDWLGGADGVLAVAQTTIDAWASTSSFDAAAAAAVTASASLLVQKAGSAHNRHFTATCCSPAGELLVIDVDDLCDAACGAAVLASALAAEIERSRILCGALLTRSPSIRSSKRHNPPNGRNCIISHHETTPLLSSSPPSLVALQSPSLPQGNRDNCIIRAIDTRARCEARVMAARRYTKRKGAWVQIDKNATPPTRTSSFAHQPYPRPTARLKPTFLPKKFKPVQDILPPNPLRPLPAAERERRYSDDHLPAPHLVPPSALVHSSRPLASLILGKHDGVAKRYALDINVPRTG